jgi:hypothetical protein
MRGDTNISISSGPEKTGLEIVRAQCNKKASGVPLGKPFGFIHVCASLRIIDFFTLGFADFRALSFIGFRRFSRIEFRSFRIDFDRASTL